MRTLGIYEGSFPISGGRCGGGVGGVWTERHRIYAICKYELRIGDPKEIEGCKDMACLLDRMLMMSSAAWRR